MKVGFIGTGLLGLPMAMRLLTHGNCQLVVYNRTASKTEPLLANGAQDAFLPHEVLRSAPVTILMLPDARAIREVILFPQLRSKGGEG